MSMPSFRLLVIDDNPAIHLDFIKILKTEPTAESELEVLKTELFGKKKKVSDVELPAFEIDVASQGQEGVKKIEAALKEGKPYSLAFVDIRMPPGWDGVETIKHIWSLDKDIQIVICTAYSDYSWEETVAHLGKSDNLLILKKPFDNVAVRQLACALTKKWQLAEESRRYTENLKEQVAERTLSLQRSLSLVKSTFESSSDAIMVINTQGEITDYNHNFLDLLDIPKSVVEKKDFDHVLAYLKKELENKSDDFISRFSKLTTNPGKITIDVLRFKNGKIFECYSQPQLLNNKIIGRILDFRDITKRAKLEEELQYQATHDALTGLANRVKLMENIKKDIQKGEKDNSQFAVLFLDLDRFKLVNDSLSHNVGDQLLVAASKRLQSILKPQETLARLGGDEFVILLFIENENILLERIYKLLSLFKEPFKVGDRKITLTASIGVSLYPRDGKTIDILLRNADSAMYQAKSQKGNTFEIYNIEMSKRSLEELDKEAELRQAISNGEFFLTYQPQINLQDEKLEAVEALIRWKHPQKGTILPIDFIPLAEETGLIIPISEWVMKEACQQNKKWQEEGYPPIRVAVNLTAHQFKQSNLIPKIRETLKETGLKPEYLELELTENVILSNREIIKTVTELKKLGVVIAIDDFGTGYSSLNYLHKIPLDRLKIDSSFIQHIKSATDDEVIIRAIIAMAKNLNLEVLAEGVETEEQLNFLKRYKCGDVQGFYFSKPLMVNELEEFFNHPEIIKKLSHEISENK